MDYIFIVISALFILSSIGVGMFSKPTWGNVAIVWILLALGVVFFCFALFF